MGRSFCWRRIHNTDFFTETKEIVLVRRRGTYCSGLQLSEVVQKSGSRKLQAPLRLMTDSGDESSLIGKTISHYRIVSHLGAGGMGVIYEAEDLKLHRHAALKFLPAGMENNPAARERF